MFGPAPDVPLYQAAMSTHEQVFSTRAVRFHRTVSVLGRMLGGRYGQVPETSFEPSSRFRQRVGALELTGLRWDGPGPTLVLLHGLNNNAWSWAWVASQLCAQRSVVAINLRGHGGSTSPDRGYGLASTTGDVLGLLDAMGLERVDVAGHSWGGKVACHLAATAPERVRSLMLADPVPPQGLNGLLRLMPWAMTSVLRAERGPFACTSDWEHAGRSLLYLRRWDELDRRMWADSFERSPDGVVRHKLPDSGFEEILHQTLQQNIVPALGRITCRVLLMRPTLTVSFLPGETAGFRALPQLRKVRISGDHTFMHTNPIDTARAMGAFLAGESAGP